MNTRIFNELNKRKYVIIFILYFMTPILLYIPYLMKGEIPIAGDALGFYRIREIMKSSILNGEFPLWNHLLINGAPYAGDLNQAFDPLQWISLLFPTVAQVYFYYSIHIAIGAFFTFLFVRELNCSNLNGIITGFIYATSVYLGGYRKNHIMLIAVVIFLPVVLYYIERYLKTGLKKYLYFSSIALALSFLECFPQTQLYIDVVAFCYLLFGLIHKREKISAVVVSLFQWGVPFVGLIMVQLIPTAQMMYVYSGNEASKLTYSEFASYSIHPVKLIMMFIPKIFDGNIINYRGFDYSSEMDIEIYLGLAVVVFLLFGFFRFFKDYQSRLVSLIMIASFLFSSAPHIPGLGKIIYALPVFGSFRICSRALFIFSFFGIVLFSITLEKVMNSMEILNQFFKVLIIFVLSNIAAFAGLFTFAQIAGSNIITEHLSKNKDTFLEYFIALLIFVCIVTVFRSVLLKTGISSLAVNIFCIGIGIFTVLQVLPYSMLTSPSKISDIKNEQYEAQYQYISQNIGTGKVIVANSNVDGGYDSMFSSEKGVYYGIPSINAYISLNNPNLYRLLSPNGFIGPKQNFSGLYTGFEEINRNLYENNDILSMLGIKYVIDSMNYISDDGMTVSNFEKEDPVGGLSDKVNIDNKNNQVSVNQTVVPVSSEQYYVCSIDAVNNSDSVVNAYFDLYGGADYDSAKQERQFKLSKGENKLNLLIYSGTVPADREILLRFVTTDNCSLNLNELTLYTAKVEMKQLYKLISTENGQRIFENLNAHEVLYSTDQLIGVSSFDDIYKNQSNYDFNKSYIIGSEAEDLQKVNISDINWTNNRVEANVDCPGDTGFINFSNNYFPGWKAYVDGQKTKIYEVNGLIQGIKVSKGSHKIEFRFEPVSIYIGASISVLTLLIVVSYIIMKGRKRHE